MPDYTRINNEEFNAILIALENNCRSTGQTDKLKGDVKEMILKGNKCEVTYDDNSVDRFINDALQSYFRYDYRRCEVDGRQFYLIITTEEITGLCGRDNIAVKYSVKILCESNKNYKVTIYPNPIGRISLMNDKRALDDRLVEEIKKVLDKDFQGDCAISEDNLDISHRYELKS